MKVIKTMLLQSYLDVAIQHTGKVENAFTIALANGKSITDELSAGSNCFIPEVIEDKDVFNYYRSKGIQPATAITASSGVAPQLEGISYWAVGYDFKIS